jgi:hypothetical protein
MTYTLSWDVKSGEAAAQPSPVNVRRQAAPPAQAASQDLIPLAENIELKKLRPVEADQEEEEDDGLRMPTAEDLMVAGEVGVLSVGMVLENSFFQLRGFKRAFNRQPALARGIELITLAALILSVIGFVAVREVKAYIKSHQGTFLAEALVAPYDLETQAVPAPNAAASSLLPSTIGKFRSSNQPISQNFPSSPTHQCLLAIGYPRDAIGAPNCVRNYGTTGTAYSRYATSNYKTADLVVARFASQIQAEGTMFDLLHHAREFGQVGNFSIGATGSVNYFYSSVRGWFSFTWSRGPWIFSVSGPNLQYVEDLITHYQVPQTDPLRTSPGA